MRMTVCCAVCCGPGAGKIRDDWMAADMAGWLAPNAIYPGVAEACIAAEVGAARHCSPRHPTHLRPSFIELNEIL